MQQIPWNLILIFLVYLCFICWELRFNSCWQGPNSSRYRIILLSALSLSHTLALLYQHNPEGSFVSAAHGDISHQPMWEPGFILSSLRWKILEKIHTLEKFQPNWVPVPTTEIWITPPLCWLFHSSGPILLAPLLLFPGIISLTHALQPSLCLILCFKWKPN